MKIDIHVHTKKIKQGDAPTREITAERFSGIIKQSDTKILAITNHNHFDLEQYNALKSSVDGFCQVWPGVELDILEEGNKAHLIVIVDPGKASAFSNKVNSILDGFTPDNFKININETVKAFDDFSPLYIAHYHSKSPSLLDSDVEKLLSLVSNKQRVLKEASNSISAGIYISHGHNSIYGSDIHDWDKYLEISKTLPELRLPVDSFEQFCLLLDKDEPTINTILRQKQKETLQINPFNNIAELMDIDIYNDINIIFGSKGTGKTDILRALSKRYNEEGHNTKVYESNALKLETIYDLKGLNFSTSVDQYGIDECEKEIRFIKNSTEKTVTRISDYYQYFVKKETNNNSKKLKVKDFVNGDAVSPKREFEDVYSSLERFEKFQKEIKSDEVLKNVIGNQLLNDLNDIIDKISNKLFTETNIRFSELKSIELFNHLIKVFTLEVAKKTGQPEKPLTTGFQSYASNRIKIELTLKKILDNISVEIEPETKYVGYLGEKGDLYCQTNLKLQDGNFVNVKYSPVSHGVNKNPQKSFAKCLSNILKYSYSNDLFEKINELNNVEYSESITCLTDLLLYNRHFTLNSLEYEPSNGESSMVLLYNELSEEKSIYIIDEPEKSLGNDYISDVIVPLLKEHAQRGKKVIIATHDANIAVRTLPYNSIYRGHDSNGYFTYVGNPFSNNLTCLSAKRENLNWKLISMKTLEGGQQAFGERGKIYGKV